jgi:prolyl 4-hydroxylase
MLINHLDIEYTHLASAVIQVGQKVDPNGGWPLEVMNPDGTGALTEVYLQEGEMVLYEGARLKHGRPMRFRGEQFGNIFSHFAPYKWKGLNVPYEHEKFKDEL